MSSVIAASTMNMAMDDKSVQLAQIKKLMDTINGMQKMLEVIENSTFSNGRLSDAANTKKYMSQFNHKVDADLSALTQITFDDNGDVVPYIHLGWIDAEYFQNFNEIHTFNGRRLIDTIDDVIRQGGSIVKDSMAYDLIAMLKSVGINYLNRVSIDCKNYDFIKNIAELFPDLVTKESIALICNEKDLARKFKAIEWSYRHLAAMNVGASIDKGFMFDMMMNRGTPTIS
jgi:hypothetical protein